MSCAGCASAIEKTIQEVDGVAQGNVNFALSQATITYDPKITNLSTIQQAVKDLGYHASPIAETKNEEDLEKATRVAEQKELTRKVIVGSIISILLIIGVLPMMTGLGKTWIPTFLQKSWVQFILVTPVMFWVGQGFFIAAWKNFKRHSANMDTLVALGAGVAYLSEKWV